MAKYFTCFLSLLILFNNGLADSKSAKITYIANTGFLIETQNNKVLIDALFGKKELGYCDTPDSTVIESIIKGKDYFKNIDLVIVSHNHRDHFHAPFVQRFLINNPQAIFISTNQATELLEANEQVITANSENYTTSQFKINNILVTTLPLPHSLYMESDPNTGEMVNRHRNVKNIATLIEVDGIKIFHSGDSYAEPVEAYKKYNLKDENIDIAIIDRILLCSPEGQAIVKNHINPKHIILAHINPERKEMFKNFCKKLANEYKSVEIFEDEMDIKKYNF